MPRDTVKRIAFVSSFSARECGAAAFTSELIAGMKLASGGEFEPVVIAVERDNRAEYCEAVRRTISRDDRYDYVRAADYINFSDVEAVSVQHELGVFGGAAGSYLNLLLQRLNKPVVTTLHTVLEKPSTEHFDFFCDLCQASDKVVVTNKRGVRMLQRIYGVPQGKVELIPHSMSDEYRRSMIWPNVGLSYSSLFRRLVSSRPTQTMPGCASGDGTSVGRARAKAYLSE